MEHGTCIAQGCQRPLHRATRYGWCARHYYRWYKGGRGVALRGHDLKPRRHCSNPDCTKMARAGRKTCGAWECAHRPTNAREPGVIPHGTTGGYTNYGCRCEACRLATRRAARIRRGADPDDPRDLRKVARPTKERPGTPGPPCPVCGGPRTRSQNGRLHATCGRDACKGEQHRRGQLRQRGPWPDCENCACPCAMGTQGQALKTCGSKTCIEKLRGKKAPEARTGGQGHNPWHHLRSEVYWADMGRCWLCTEIVDPSDYQIDHVIPRSRGGPAKELWNLALAHPKCNNLKGARLVIGRDDTGRAVLEGDTEAIAA